MPIRYLTLTLLVILFIAAITGIINYKKQSRPMLFLVALLVYTFISETVAFWAAIVYRDSRIVYPFYIMVSLLLYSLFFYDVIIDKKVRNVIVLLGGSILLITILNFAFFEALKSQSGNMGKIKTIYLFLAGSVIMLQQLDMPGERNVFKDPVFLAGLTIVWFNVISSINFFFRGLIYTYKLNVPLITYTHYFSNYVHYIIFFLAMLYVKNYKNYARELHG